MSAASVSGRLGVPLLAASFATLLGPCGRGSSGSAPAVAASALSAAPDDSSAASASASGSAAPASSVAHGGTSSGLFRDVGPALFGIGKGESDHHTHVAFTAPHGLVRTRIRMRMDVDTPKGLNFIAMQVNFQGNGTWAHGGLQNADTKEGGRKRQANWGGLVNRGGGSADYKKEDDLADIEKMQNAAGGSTRPYEWKVGEVYEYVVERGKEVTLPPGDYKFVEGHPAVHVDHAREMWEWKFSARPADGGEPFTETLYDSADSIASFIVWNEHGYDPNKDEAHTSWFGAEYRTLDAPTKDVAPSAWHRD
jgi:hypothetical protein